MSESLLTLLLPLTPLYFRDRHRLRPYRIHGSDAQQRASELLLLGKPISAKEAHDRYNMVNRLVEVAKSTSEELGQAAVDQAAIELAIQLTQNSPDSVLVTKSALVMARDATDGDIDASARDNMLSDRSRLLYVGKNINEGLEAFKGVSVLPLSAKSTRASHTRLVLTRIPVTFPTPSLNTETQPQVVQPGALAGFVHGPKIKALSTQFRLVEDAVRRWSSLC